MSAPASTAESIRVAKGVVARLWAPIEERTAPFLLGPADLLADDVVFHGPAPIGSSSGRDAYLDGVIAPLTRMLPSVHRRPYLFLGGWSEVGRPGTWVASTGDMVGVMEGSWLGVPASGREMHLRFAEFYRIEEGRVTEIRCLYDVLGLAAQAGFELLPPFHGRTITPPGPAVVDGVRRGGAPAGEAAATLALVEAMLGGCNQLEDGQLESMGMAAFWHDDMVWHGPWGVGSTHGFDEFQEHAQGPSVASFPNRRGGFHEARFADGPTAAFTGWPSLRGTFDGEPFRGIEPTGGEIGQNIMDFYVRRGDRLHENWVLIDLVDFAAQCGVDLLQGLPG